MIRGIGLRMLRLIRLRAILLEKNPRKYLSLLTPSSCYIITGYYINLSR